MFKKITPFDKENKDLIVDLFEQNSAYLKTRNGGFKIYQQKYNSKNSKENNLTNLYMKIKSTYLQSLLFATKNALIFGLFSLLIFSSSMGVLAGQSLSQTNLGFSQIIKNALVPDSKNHVTILDKCDLGVKYPTKIENLESFISSDSPGTNSYKFAGALYITGSGQNALKGSKKLTFFEVNILCFENKQEISFIDSAYSEFTSSAVRGEYYLVDYQKQDLTKSELFEQTGWQISKREISKIRVYSNKSNIRPRESTIPGENLPFFENTIYSFEINNLIYFISLANISYDKLEKPLSPLDPKLVNFEFNSKAKIDPDVVISYNEFGQFTQGSNSVTDSRGSLDKNNGEDGRFFDKVQRNLFFIALGSLLLIIIITLGIGIFVIFKWPKLSKFKVNVFDTTWQSLVLLALILSFPIEFYTNLSISSYFLNSLVVCQLFSNSFRFYQNWKQKEIDYFSLTVAIANLVLIICAYTIYSLFGGTSFYGKLTIYHGYDLPSILFLLLAIYALLGFALFSYTKMIGEFVLKLIKANSEKN